MNFFFHPRYTRNRCNYRSLQIAPAVNHFCHFSRYFPPFSLDILPSPSPYLAISSGRGDCIPGNRWIETHSCFRLRRRMTYVRRSDYSFMKKLLLVLGLWPTPNSKFRLFRITFFYTVYIGYLLLEVILIITLLHLLHYWFTRSHDADFTFYTLQLYCVYCTFKWFDVTSYNVIIILLWFYYYSILCRCYLVIYVRRNLSILLFY